MRMLVCNTSIMYGIATGVAQGGVVPCAGRGRSYAGHGMSPTSPKLWSAFRINIRRFSFRDVAQAGSEAGAEYDQ